MKDEMKLFLKFRAKRKELLLLVISTFIALLLAELVAPVIYKVSMGKDFSKQEIQRKISAGAGDDVVLDETFIQTKFSQLHPYTGFSAKPNRDTGVNKYGFAGLEPVNKRSDNRVIIALTGGSVALQSFLFSSDTLISELKRSPVFAGKEIMLISIAGGGFKQPQPLMALNYFLVLGAEFDVLINLDGFNEVALPPSENIPVKVHSTYPRFWNLYFRQALDRENSLQIAKMEEIREEQRGLRRWYLAHSILYQSKLALMLWDIRNNRLEHKLYLENQKFSHLLAQKKATYGPYEPHASLLELNAELARTWKLASIQMANLCRGNDIAYFHFLHPNQYFKESKELTDEEKRTAYIEGENPLKAGVQSGYPLLLEHGKELEERGINFTDLTMIFKAEKRTVYVDTCCHFNKLGTDSIVREIAGKVVEYYVNYRD